ncbi:unnamed protein product [Miscanthus lutarioriparius]|uniref:Cytochrome P450 n=1 Tax=Miscanthus lutarioriparius TaxID=422564 RepID=A0A811MIG8_9POAL|nr:unnamed protein product [Miscanthus lutarioriparius]
MATMEVEAAAATVLAAPLLSSSAILKLLLFVVTLSYLARALSRPRKTTTKCSSTTCASPGVGNPPLPPGPVPWPVVGNLPEMLLNKPAFRWIHQMMREMGTDIACVKLGGVHVVSITCPEIAREVLRKQDANFISRPLTFASETFSGGYRNAVLSPYGDQWKKMRRVLTSEIICPSRHAWLHDKRADEADNLTRYVYNLATRAAGDVVDVRHVARHYCGNVIRRLMFNMRYFGEPQPDGGPGPMEVLHMDAVFTSLGLLYAFCVSDYLPWLRGLDIDGHEKIVKEANETVNRLHDTVIDDRWRQWKSGERQEMEDFLDVLITLKDAQGNPLLTIEEDITFAAVDNPSNAVEWALAEMVNNPEAFRLHPVAPFNVPHVALADTTIAGYCVPKGSHVILSRTGLGRNPRVWDEPLRFYPDRHLAAASDVALTENDLRFISFSTGRRGCIAASLGTAMSIMLFGRLLQGFTWSKPAGVEAVDLSESKSDTFMATPLVLHAVPRLPAHLYTRPSPSD